MTEFWPTGKMPRWNRDIIITEKIDGTNATIYIGEDGEFLVGSRTRWITPDADNHGFARWAYKNQEALEQLGPGWHRGEWWGAGINRGYGRTSGHKTFSLFDVIKWQDGIPDVPDLSRVPVLYRGPLAWTALINSEIVLDDGGSFAEPGYMEPEGIVIYHTASRQSFKITLKNDDIPKGLIK